MFNSLEKGLKFFEDMLLTKDKQSSLNNETDCIYLLLADFWIDLDAKSNLNFLLRDDLLYKDSCLLKFKFSLKSFFKDK
jgi:hypothetical protein